MKGRDAGFSHSHTEFLVFLWHLLPSQDDLVNHWSHCQRGPTRFIDWLCTKTLTHSLWLAVRKQMPNTAVVHSCPWEEGRTTERGREEGGDEGKTEIKEVHCFDSQSQQGVMVWVCSLLVFLPFACAEWLCTFGCDGSNQQAHAKT